MRGAALPRLFSTVRQLGTAEGRDSEVAQDRKWGTSLGPGTRVLLEGEEREALSLVALDSVPAAPRAAALWFFRP